MNRIRLDKFTSTHGLDRGASKSKEILWYLTKILFFLSALPYPNQFKCILLRLFGAEIGKGVVVKPRVNIHMPWKLQIGNYVWIGEEVFILNFEFITIGNNVCISQRAFLCGGNHDYSDVSFRYRNGPISLEDGSWVGASVFLGPNSYLKKNSILTAGSVGSGIFEENMIYQGNPAKAIRERKIKLY
ncbi:WcaF family extracellular polysaccharide biosynthesis acetyltransferase [Leeuwenhoekiella aequorea]|uniref:Putative colanic acid biosynthesis acetyltransferase WcaF n=1 Tax=Leeuwenhoekiella aequorea TaxID=283736 RepID=A0A4Q0P1S2_9FLAO|nr:WcaF family extracellular polysaccharide biosynthesis acetyltransferase [Leeuwenhoekiella aequorea]RXG20444.1 putative colanic acid biosynthesis acetyltransferase WcaF [Leeuwenhoekiella aequorea]